MGAGVSILKSYNLARCGFSANPCSLPSSLINCAVLIFAFNLTELVDAFVPNLQFLLNESSFPLTALVVGFNCCILLFIVKEVIQCSVLLLRIVHITWWNRISPKPLAIYNISFFLIFQALFHLFNQLIFFLTYLDFNILDLFKLVFDVGLWCEEVNEQVIINFLFDLFAVLVFNSF